MRDTDWRMLTVLYEKQSMTKAAEALYMTQSALTKRLRAMEEEWGIEIVRRTSKGVVFTEDGNYLVNQAMHMLNLLQEIEDHFARKSTARDILNLGVPNSYARLHLPELLKTYHDRYDGLQITTVSNSSDHLMRLLNDGSIDMAVICGDFPYLGEKTLLFEEQLRLIAPKEIPAEELGTAPLINYYLNPMVRMMADQWWKGRFGSAPRAAYSVPYADIAIEMVQSGLGITMLFGDRWRVSEEKLQRIPALDANGEPISRRVWLMLTDRCFASQAIMDFVSLTEEYYGVN